MRAKYLNHSGVPLGGMGAGKIEFCPDGAFRNVTTQNNIDLPISSLGPSGGFSLEGLPYAFLAAFAQGYGAVVLKEHARTGYSVLGEGNIGFRGMFPVAEASYPDMGGASVSLTAFSSLALDDDGSDGYKDSSLPAAVFRLVAHNRTGHRKRVSFAFSWPNIIGIGGYPRAQVYDLRGNDVRPQDSDAMTGLVYFHHVPKLDARVEGEYVLAVPKLEGASASHVITQTWVQNRPDALPFWDDFAGDGILDDTHHVIPQPLGQDVFGALAVTAEVEPGRTLEVPFVLAWYFPNRPANEAPGVTYRNAYVRWFGSAWEVAAYVLAERGRLYSQTRAWQERFERSNLPGWLVTKLVNNIFPVYTNSFYVDDGRFSVNESPTDMSGCMGTIDQRSASNSIYTMCFPGLSRAELKLFGEQQIGADHPERFGSHWDTLQGVFGRRIDRLGAIRHDVGWDNLEGGRLGYKEWTNLHWPDLTSVFVLQGYEYFTWTGDRGFLEYFYPKVKLALSFQERLDQDGDGIAELWGPGCCTYDNEEFPYYGASSFVASLYLAALAAAASLGRLLGDAEAVAEWERRAGQARESMESRLWHEDLGHFLCWRDEHSHHWSAGERSHPHLSENCMVAQVAGCWFAAMLNLGPILDPRKVACSLEQVAARNVGMVDGCPANEVTVDGRPSTSWPFYVETYFAASAAYHGRPDAALTALERIYAATFALNGSPWNVPLAWRGPGNTEPAWGKWYMTNPSSWFILNALAGFNYNAATGEMMLKPNPPTAMGGRLEHLPIFMPLFWACVDTSPGRIELTVERLIGAGSLPVRTLVVRDDAAGVLVNGRLVDFEVSPVGGEEGGPARGAAGPGEKVLGLRECELGAGDRLTVESK